MYGDETFYAQKDPSMIHLNNYQALFKKNYVRVNIATIGGKWNFQQQYKY